MHRHRSLFQLAPLVATVLSVGSVSCASGETRPRAWTYAELLAPPTDAEIRRAAEDWNAPAPRVDALRRVSVTSVPVGEQAFEARLYTYTANGANRCGVALVPRGAAPRSRAGILDIPDIRWDYVDRNLTSGPYLGRILGGAASEFVVLVPCVRGMAIRLGDARLAADGDRRDAWIGAAKDAMSFLTAALSAVPELDSSRLAAYGYSRGGGVALLVGERDPRIKAVLAFAAPTDWFAAMARPGTNWAAQLERAARDPDFPADTRESQYLDWFVRGREHLSLGELRRRMIGASALYYAERLPAVQIHHGERDQPVPVVNALLLRDRLPRDSAHQVFVYSGAGHMLDEDATGPKARSFLRTYLLNRR